MGNVADNDHIFGSEKKKSRGYDALDRELDAALAQYGAGEPKAGLEQRVLTNLQAEREKIASRTWWRWPVTVALAAAVTIAVGVSLTWRSAKTSPVVSVDRPPTSVESGGQNGQLLAGDLPGGTRQTVIVAGNPQSLPDPSWNSFHPPSP